MAFQTGANASGRVTFLACARKVTKRTHPHGTALRASPGLTCSSRAVPTRRPVALGLNGPSMAHLPGFHRPVHGGPKGALPTPTLVQQFSAGRRIPRSPLEAPWPGLRRPGERAMEGPFSPATTGCCVGTARSERPRPWLARRAPPWGCPFFGTFLWASKERYSPARDAGRSKCVA